MDAQDECIEWEKNGRKIMAGFPLTVSVLGKGLFLRPLLIPMWCGGPPPKKPGLQREVGG